MLESKVQLALPAKNVIMAVLTPKSVMQLTPFTTFETGRNLNYVSCNMCIFATSHYFLSLKREVFPSLLSNNRHNKHS